MTIEVGLALPDAAPLQQPNVYGAMALVEVVTLGPTS